MHKDVVSMMEDIEAVIPDNTALVALINSAIERTYTLGAMSGIKQAIAKLSPQEDEKEYCEACGADVDAEGFGIDDECQMCKAD